MDIPPPELGEPSEFDLVALNLCAMFRAFPGSHVAPMIPTSTLSGFLRTILHLRDDETLLAIVSAKEKAQPGAGCALTTKRIYWMGFAAAAKTSGEPPPIDDSPAAKPAPGSRFSRSLAYKDLPETIERVGGFSSFIDLQAAGRLGLGGSKPLQELMIQFLTEIRGYARAESVPPGLPAHIKERRIAEWPEVLRLTEQARVSQDEIRAFQSRHGRKRLIVTPIILFACVGLYLAMLATGISAISPSNESMLKWGADFGPSLAFDHEYWRLITCVFLHFGLIHLALNMWCLLIAGPTVERFYGRLSFAALYLLSGLGGSVASLWMHPTIISAGASGAIFGIFGGLLGYLAVLHREVPAAILKPMRSGATAFLGYNLIFGFFSPQIDMGAHVGGLVTGFVVGLLLILVSPRSASTKGLSQAIRRLGIVATVALALGVGAWEGIKAAPPRIFSDPEMGANYRDSMIFIPEWNDFVKETAPLLNDLDKITSEMYSITTQFNQRNFPRQPLLTKLDSQIAEQISIAKRIETVPVKNEEIRQMRAQLTLAQSHQLESLQILKRYVDASVLDRAKLEKDFVASMDAYNSTFARFGKLREDYFKAHRMDVLPE